MEHNHILINYQFVSSSPSFSVHSPFMCACSPNDSFEIKEHKIKENIIKEIKEFTIAKNNLMWHKNSEYFRTCLPRFHYYPLFWKLYERCIYFLEEKSTISINLHYLKCHIYFEDTNLSYKRLSVSMYAS